MADSNRTTEERLTADDGREPSAAQGLLPDVLAVALRDEAWSWPFHSVLRRLERRHRDVPAFGASKRLDQELPLRLGQDATLKFPASELSSWRPEGERSPARLGEVFFGLFGSNGPLPLHLTDFAIQRRDRHKDPTLVRFADVFHHRLLCLLHRAWVRAHPTFAADRLDEDPVPQWIASLFGQMGEAFHDRDSVADLDKVYFAGILANESCHCEGLENLLAEYFGADAEVVEFLGEWVDVPADSRVRLGHTSRLGLSSSLGNQLWSTQHKFRIVLGPLGSAQFARLLPDGPDWPVLCDLVRNAVGLELDWDVNLVLQSDDVPALQLDGRRRLGWTAVLPGSVCDHLRHVILDPRAYSSGVNPTAAAVPQQPIPAGVSSP